MIIGFAKYHLINSIKQSAYQSKTVEFWKCQIGNFLWNFPSFQRPLMAALEVCKFCTSKSADRVTLLTDFFIWFRNEKNLQISIVLRFILFAKSFKMIVFTCHSDCNLEKMKDKFPCLEIHKMKFISSIWNIHLKYSSLFFKNISKFLFLIIQIGVPHFRASARDQPSRH